MATDVPLSRMILAATSVADDLGFVAMADVSSGLSALSDIESRLIGGHMVTLLVQRWDLGRELYRETQDADVGIQPIAVKDGRLIQFLKDRGYERTTGNTYARTLDDIPATVEGAQTRSASIDLLVPAYTSRARDNVKVSDDLTTTEVPGLAESLLRPGIEIALELHRLNGTALQAELVLPDEASAVMLKALAWRQRSASKDAVDLWRTLEVAVVAGVSPSDFQSATGEGIREIAQQAFERVNDGAMKAIASAQRLSNDSVQERHTRIQALLRRVLASHE
jgi:hypothetical protein